MSGYLLPGVIAGERHVPAAAGAYSTGAHSYWRLEIDATDGGPYACLSNLQMLDGHGSLDLCVGGTALSSDDIGLGLSTKAFDGDLSTYWQGAANGWLGYHFTSAVQISVVVIGAALDPALVSQTPTVWRLEWSDDGVSWTTAFQVIDGGGYAQGEHRTYLDASYEAARAANGGPASIYGAHSYCQLQLLTALQPPYQIADLSLAATPGGPSQCTGGTPLASSANDSAHRPANAFDGDLSTFWWSAGSANTEALGYQFPSPVVITAVAITAPPSPFSNVAHANFEAAPLRAQVLLSDDGVRWTAAWTFVHEPSPPNWSAGEVVSCPDPHYYAPTPDFRITNLSLSAFVPPPDFFRFTKLDAQALAIKNPSITSTHIAVTTIATGGDARLTQMRVEAQATPAHRITATQATASVQATPATRITTTQAVVSAQAVPRKSIRNTQSTLAVHAAPRKDVRVTEVTLQIIRTP